ncbi:transglutaminase family protein [Devosia sp.]|uniref:transglutaminase-like domain-containing protein n=1 Tax=Devosia sp. TaxID=1871048 RepID=UPI003263A14D
MQIKAGFSISYDCPKPTPMLLSLNLHPSRRVDLLTPQVLSFSPSVESWDYYDTYGNACTRITAPQGRLTVTTGFDIYDPGTPDFVPHDAAQHNIQDLPDEVLIYLLGSRYCETDRLTNVAWQMFGNTKPGWPRVQAILDFVHRHITFSYPRADRTRTAFGAYTERVGVCRDFAHLALTLCRCMNIPARYCTGYLGDIGVPPDVDPMDFSGWFEVYLGGHWYTADARHNFPRIGRILMAIGRDATDVALSTQFGPATLSGFSVVTTEVATAAG